MQRTAPQKWTRDRLGPSYCLSRPDDCAECGCAETAHEWPRDPNATARDLLPGTTAYPALVGKWPPGTTRGACRSGRGCSCAKYRPGRQHPRVLKMAGRPDPHSAPLPAYLRRKYRGPMAWEAADQTAPPPQGTHAPGGMG